MIDTKGVATIKRRIYTKIAAHERDLLAVWKAEGISNKECARRLNREASTIGRELKRNSWKKDYYVSIHAQRQALLRDQKKTHGKHALKNADVYKYVTEHLRDGWSPDQIAGRLKREYPNDRHFWITAETIYRWIYQPKQMHEDQPWYEYLRRKQKRRKKRSRRKVHRAHIPDRISIRERDEEVNNRVVFGHWEGDTVEGKGHRDGIHTEVERMARFAMGRKVDAITSEEASRVQEELFAPLPEKARLSTTLDNGRENHMHTKLWGLGMKTYFADPYSSWQRGTNEHGNWHIRYYFPKGTDFKTIDDEELQDVIDEINNRPRKILGYQTAKEVFDQLLANEEGVAINY